MIIISVVRKGIFYLVKLKLEGEDVWIKILKRKSF